MEDEWWSDPRRSALARTLGCELMADGMMLRVWFFAQRYWRKKELIPEHAWNGAGFGDSLFTCGLAERRDAGVYVRGAERHFEWYHAKTGGLSAGSSAGGKSRISNALRDEKGRLLPAISNIVQPVPCRDPGESSPSSSSSSSKNKKKNTSTSADTPPLLEIWNASRGRLPGARGCGRSRARQAAARWKEIPDSEYWHQVVRRMAASDFCNGGGSTEWVATFDFLLKPDTHHAVLEGKYDSKPKKKELIYDVGPLSHEDPYGNS